MAAINIPVISEKEYPLFRSIGVLSQFPEDYSAFLDFMSKKNKEICRGGIIAVNVNIDFAGFRDWFIGPIKIGRKYATYNDLLKYASLIINR